MDGLDAQPPAGKGHLQNTVSNIFRTKSLLPGLQGGPSGISAGRTASGADNEARHWTIAVPAEPSAAQSTTQAGHLELASLIQHIADAEGSTLPHQLSASSGLSASHAAIAQGSASFARASSHEHRRRTDSDMQAAGSPFAHAPLRQPSKAPSGNWQDQSPFRWQAVEVDIYSLGRFVFKGMSRPQQIVQVLPTALTSRLALFSHVLKRGKATCIQQDDRHLHSVRMWLPDIAGLDVAR